MIPAFRLHRPTDLGAATALLAALGDGARLYAGGTELLLVLREGMLEADDLVDLKRIAGLADIGVDPAAAVLRIGALATHTQVAESEVVRERLPAFAAAEAALANRRVRNVGTIGGNLSFAEPHSDTATLLVALDARLRLIGAGGERTVRLEDWLLGPFEVDLQPGEILRGVDVPLPAQPWAMAYRRFRIHERPTVSAAVVVEGSGGRVVAGCAGPRPTRVPQAEALLAGLAPDAGPVDVERVAAACGEAAAELVDAVSDIYGPEAHKRRVAAVLMRRAALAALGKRAGAGRAA